MFIKYLTKESHKLIDKKAIDKKGNLTYDELADMVQKNKKLEFLHQIVPRKLTIREIRRLMAKESDDESSSDEESSSSGSGDSSDEENNSKEVNSISSETESKKDEDDDDDDIIEVSSTTTSGSSVVEIIESAEVNENSKTNKKK